MVFRLFLFFSFSFLSYGKGMEVMCKAPSEDRTDQTEAKSLVDQGCSVVSDSRTAQSLSFSTGEDGVMRASYATQSVASASDRSVNTFQVASALRSNLIEPEQDLPDEKEEGATGTVVQNQEMEEKKVNDEHLLAEKSSQRIIKNQSSKE